MQEEQVDLGHKRTCPCGSVKYYDFYQDVINCPECGKSIEAVNIAKPKRGRKAGISVPNDISVVGFDDIEISNTYIPTLTTVRQDRFELGLSAAQSMIKSLNNEKPQLSIYNKVIDVELVIRESTAPPMSTK